MNTTFKTFAAASVAFAFSLNAGAATIDVYSDQSSWQSSIDSFETETFERDALVSGLSISSGWSKFSTESGKMHDRINDHYAPTVFSFENGATAFGGIFDLSGPGGEGTGITVEVELTGGEVITQEISPTLNNDFWGFALDQSFVSVSFTEGTMAALFETYTIDDLFFAQAGGTTSPDVVSVPEPASIALMGLGLAAFGLRRRRKTL